MRRIWGAVDQNLQTLDSFVYSAKCSRGFYKTPWRDFFVLK